MRRFLSFGDGLPLTTVTLLVLGPVLFGLALIAFYPVFEPSWWTDLLLNPAKHPLLFFWLFIFLRAMFEPSSDDEGDAECEARPRSTLTRFAVSLFAMGGGMLICLAIILDRNAPTTTNQDVAAYTAIGLMLLSIALEWRESRERNGFGRDQLSEQG